MAADLLDHDLPPTVRPACAGAVADLPTNQLAPPGSAPAPARPAAPLDSEAPTGPAGPPTAYPRPGQFFAGFEILSELGRGAMGRVFLAQQQSPVSRAVVLKVGPGLSGECRKLARLQHPNVVPVYSFHEHAGTQAVCMPYRGPLTLAHVLARLRNENLHTFDGRTLTTVIEECRKGRRPAVEALDSVGGAAPAPGPGAAPGPAAPFGGLRGLNHVDAVLTIVRQIAEGLRAAHAEGIVHSDLKPANVLIADDGNAQLLDFGVSYDQADLSAAKLRLGGTRPYMAPEQLKSLATSSLRHDARCDLYAVGVLLYELLTGRLPFAPDLDPSAASLERDMAARSEPPPAVRGLNPRVPAAVASVLAKCLAPDPADRYQSAAHLLDDLDRQLARRPLKHAPNTSRGELVRKWAARNRVLLALAAVLAVGGAAAGGAEYRASRQAEEVRRLEALAAADEFAAEAAEAEFYCGWAAGDPSYRPLARESALRALDRLGARDHADWFARPGFADLPGDRRDALRRRAAGVLLLLADSHAQEGARATDPGRRGAAFDAARAWNERAEAAHPAPAACRAVWNQRGFIARLGGDPARGEALSRQAEAARREPADAVLEGRQHLTEGRTHAALKLFAEAAEGDPRNFWAHFSAAACQQLLGRHREALAGYAVCEALRPGFFGTAYNRGLARLHAGDPGAEGDFARALAARPGWADAHFYRANAREAKKDYAGALEDLSAALEHGYSANTVYLVRSRVNGRLGRADAAKADLARGLETAPADARGWLSRAQARLHRDPAAALGDYEQALRLDPRLTLALHGKAHVLSRLDRNREAEGALTALIEVNPDDPEAWAGRGVLRARLGNRTGALADAREALRLADRPIVRYLVAGIYATTSRANPADRREALSLLDAALRDGAGFEHLDTDPDLDPVRGDEFRTIVTAARAHRAAVQKP